MSDREDGWDAWLGTLGQPDRDQARWLRIQFEALSAADPAGWARSQVEEGIPHLSRYQLVKSLWTDCIDGWVRPGELEQLPAAVRLLNAGADRADLAQVARAAAYEAVFALLSNLDEGRDLNASGVDTGWVLMETGEDGSPTGRVLPGLHEELASMDPSGRDGTDLWE